MVRHLWDFTNMIEFAALIFILITIPLWLPIAFFLALLALGIIVIGLFMVWLSAVFPPLWDAYGTQALDIIGYIAIIGFGLLATYWLYFIAKSVFIEIKAFIVWAKSIIHQIKGVIR